MWVFGRDTTHAFVAVGSEEEAREETKDSEEEEANSCASIRYSKSSRTVACHSDTSDSSTPMRRIASAESAPLCIKSDHACGRAGRANASKAVRRCTSVSAESATKEKSSRSAKRSALTLTDTKKAEYAFGGAVAMSAESS